jgi:NADH-quinone oxidoreductase subunit H
MATVSALATTLFLGGWHVPFWIDNVWEGANHGYWPFLWFMGKVMFFVFIFIWLRGTLPRLRYDQFMHFGWKRLIPISLAWIVLVAAIRTVNLNGGFDRTWLYVAIGVLAALLLIVFFLEDSKREIEPDDSEAAFDAYAGGYPVPPMSSPADLAARRADDRAAAQAAQEGGTR